MEPWRSCRPMVPQIRITLMRAGFGSGSLNLKDLKKGIRNDPPKVMRIRNSGCAFLTYARRQVISLKQCYGSGSGIRCLFDPCTRIRNPE
jgi:hypothetical protein